MEATVPDVLQRLAAEGYPITDQRRALVALVLAQGKRFTADDLLAEARARRLAVGRATVFRTLDLLERLGYVGRVHDGGRGGYTACALGHHHHLVCSACGQVLHIEGCPVSGYLRELESRTGFHVASHRLEIAGVCPACSRNEASADAGDRRRLGGGSPRDRFSPEQPPLHELAGQTEPLPDADETDQRRQWTTRQIGST